MTGQASRELDVVVSLAGQDYYDDELEEPGTAPAAGRTPGRRSRGTVSEAQPRGQDAF